MSLFNFVFEASNYVDLRIWPLFLFPLISSNSIQLNIPEKETEKFFHELRCSKSRFFWTTKKYLKTFLQNNFKSNVICNLLQMINQSVFFATMDPNNFGYLWILAYILASVTSSVTRLVDFWKFLATNLLIELAKLLATFGAILKKSLLK